MISLLFLACNGRNSPGNADSTPGDAAFQAAVSEGLPSPQVPCDLDPDVPSDEWISPSDGAVVTTSPWIPLKMVFTEKELWTDIRTWVDCVETTDPLAMQRNIPAFLGDGSDYLAYADLTDLDDGPHVIVARLEDDIGTIAWQASRFTIDRPKNRLHVSVRNADGDRIDARIVVLSNGAPYPLQSPDALAVDPEERDDEINMFLVPGQASIWLDDGDYELIATRGSLDTVDVQSVHVDGNLDLSFVVDDAFDMNALSRGDFHVHTPASVDSFLPMYARVQSLLSSGLDLASITDHEVIHDLEEEIATVSHNDSRLVSVSGVEISMYMGPAPDPKKVKEKSKEDDATVDEPETGDGHMGVFPLDPATTYPERVVNLGRYLGLLRDAQLTTNPMKDGVLELNHPRGMQLEPSRAMETNADLFNGMGFDGAAGFGNGANAWMADTDGGARPMDFDALEIINRSSWPGYTQVRQDWFAMLGWGRRITGVGNSDSHAMTTEYVGLPTNVAECTRTGDDDKGRDEFIECWVRAVREGRIRVTTGPLVTLTLTAGKSSAEIGGILDPAAGVTAHVHVQAADWVPVDEVRLVVDGTVVETRTLTKADRTADGSLDLTDAWPVAVTGGDQWVVAEAGWPLDHGYPADTTELGTYALVVPGYLPMGFTNPVFIDGNGDGIWGTGD
jgi:hypothetical protein